jgi:hypothetical protein
MSSVKVKKKIFWSVLVQPTAFNFKTGAFSENTENETADLHTP